MDANLILPELIKLGPWVVVMAAVIIVLYKKSEASNDARIELLTKAFMDNMSVLKDNTIAFNANTKSNDLLTASHKELIAKLESWHQKGA